MRTTKTRAYRQLASSGDPLKGNDVSTTYVVTYDERGEAIAITENGLPYSGDVFLLAGELHNHATLIRKG